MKKVLLTILDGWGIAPKSEFNAIENAKTPNFDRLVREYPNTRLKADGEAVGLPEGQYGTSEVNHMTIGAGRVIWQDLPKINKSIENGDFFKNTTLLNAIEHARKNNSALHLIGIFSDGGVHTTYQHPIALLEMLSREKFTQPVYLHLFTDGRDTPPKSAEKYLEILDKEITKRPDLHVVFATFQGRIYLDRDRDWDKTETAFQLIANAKGKNFKNWKSIIEWEYNKSNVDEYFSQYALSDEGKLKENDSVLFFHYRTDRLFQIVQRVLQEKITNLKVTTFINVSDDFKDVDLAFPREKIEHTLAETISSAGKSQLHTTETEKYTHLTFFLNGEKEQELPYEKWKLVESNRYVKPYYNIEPSMRNFDICKEIVGSIEKDEYDFIIANFSSPDMVGHTGDYNAAVVSAQAVDHCLGKIFEVLQDKLDDYAWIITADHGNSEIMWDYENNQPHTQHTTSPVPFILVTNGKVTLHRRDTLSDIAPTVLDLMDIKKPEVMTGESLIMKK